MTSSQGGQSVRLTGFELLVASILDVVRDRSTKRAVHRTTLYALVDAMLDDPTFSVRSRAAVAHTGRLRTALADALTRLRQDGLVVLDDDGFSITDVGRNAVESATTAPPVERDKLLTFVGQKSQEWQAPPS